MINPTTKPPVQRTRVATNVNMKRANKAPSSAHFWGRHIMAFEKPGQSTPLSQNALIKNQCGMSMLLDSNGKGVGAVAEW